MKRIVFALSVVFLFSSCASHYDIVSTTTLPKNVVYEDIAFGVAQTKHILGIGGLSQDALVFEAKRELMKNRPLKPNEEYSNFTVDFKKTYWPFYIQTKVTVSADVVSFTDNTSITPFSENYKEKLLRVNVTNDLFCIGDTILYNKTKRGTIISFVNSNTVRIAYLTKTDKVRTKNMSIYDIYSPSKAYRNCEPGGIFTYSKGSGEKAVLASGQVYALGLNSLIVKVGNELLVMRYDQ